MPGKKFTVEQIVAKLREAEIPGPLLATGRPLSDGSCWDACFVCGTHPKARLRG